MRYYTIITSSTPKIIGRKFPQLTPKSGVRYDNPLSIQKLSDDYPMTQTNSVYEIEKSAKITDIMSFDYGSGYFLINQKTKEVFSQFNIQDTYFIPMEVIEPSHSTWYVVYFPYSEKSTDLINYDETNFFITDSAQEENHGEFKIGNAAIDKRQVWREYAKKTEKNQLIGIKELVIKKKYQHVDVLYLSPFYWFVIFSENIKIAFEKEGITGLDFKEKAIRFA